MWIEQTPGLGCRTTNNTTPKTTCIQLAQIISLTIIGKTALQSCHGNSRAFDGSECRCLFSGQDLQGYG